MSDPSRFLTAPNFLSIGRALLAIPFAWVMLSAMPDARLWGAGIMAVAALTDKLDGLIARRRGEATEWGKVLDPLADKIAAGTAALVLLALGDIPVWFVLVVLARDLLIFAGGLYARARTGRILPSNAPGRWAFGILGLSFLAFVLQWGGTITAILMTGSLVLLLLSFALYLKRFLAVVNRPAGSPPEY